MHYHWDFFILERYMPLLWRGVLVTLAYTIGTVLLGLLIGLVVGIGRLSRSRLLNLPLIAYIEAFRCTPLLVQLIWFYYALPVLLGIQIPAVAAATMTLSLYTGAFYAEIFRGGIISIERGQWDAARALGLRPGQMMRRVILPQAIRRMVPPFVNQSITQLKNTSLVSVIAVPDVLYNGGLVAAATYRPLEVYTVVAVVYFVLLFPSTLLAQAYERRLARGR
jgi:polar amino acid transport system permease protein